MKCLWSAVLMGFFGLVIAGCNGDTTSPDPKAPAMDETTPAMSETPK